MPEPWSASARSKTHRHITPINHSVSRVPELVSPLSSTPALSRPSSTSQVPSSPSRPSSIFVSGSTSASAGNSSNLSPSRAGAHVVTVSSGTVFSRPPVPVSLTAVSPVTVSVPSALAAVRSASDSGTVSSGQPAAAAPSLLSVDVGDTTGLSEASWVACDDVTSSDVALTSSLARHQLNGAARSRDDGDAGRGALQGNGDETFGVAGGNSMGFQIMSVTQSQSEDAIEDSGDEECGVDAGASSSVTLSSDGSTDMPLPSGGTVVGALASPSSVFSGLEFSAVDRTDAVTLRRTSAIFKSGVGDEDVGEHLPVIPTTDGFGITLVAGPGLADIRNSGLSAEVVVDFPADIEMDVTASGLTVANTSAVQEPEATWQSRFKVVKIETNVPFRRGRWQCMDYMDQPDSNIVATSPATTPAKCTPSEATEAAADAVISGVDPGDQALVSSGGQQSSVTPHFTQHQHRALLPSDSDPVCSNADSSRLHSVVTSPLDDHQPAHFPVSSATDSVFTGTDHSGVAEALRLSNMTAVDRVLSAATAAAASSDSGYSGATSGSAGGATVDTTKAEPIDNKIEQAMDLVKSHLLLAVREEVDVLKTTIGRLMERISSLERENDVLRVNVPADVLHQLETLASAAPPPAAAPPAALPPTSQPSVTASQCPSTTVSPPNAPPGGGSV